MIRRLRWKVISLNMGMVFCVLLAVFAAVYFSSRAGIARSVQHQLQQVLQTGSGYDLSQPGQEGVPCFVAEVYASGTVRVSGNSYYDLTDKEALVDIVTAALTADSDEGVLAAICAICGRRGCCPPVSPLPTARWSRPPSAAC